MRRVFSSLLFPVLAPVALYSAQAMAAPSDQGFSGGRPPEPPSFSELDSNGDGLISRDEAASIPPLADHFDDIDSNSDGYLTEQELQAGKPGPSGQPPRSE